MALTAVTRKKAVLTALNWKSSGVTGVEPEKKAALTALNSKKSGVNGVEQEN